MARGAHTPEELETLLEDAFLTHDHVALAELFEDGGVLVAEDRPEARGAADIRRLAAVLWDGPATYVPDASRVVQARDTALVVAQGGIGVARRGTDRAWRYAIALLSVEANTTEEES